MFKQYKWSEVVTAYAFLVLALLLAVLFIVLPIGKAINYSFTDYYLLKPQDRQYIGFDNYYRIFTDELFLKTFFNTVKFVVFVVPIQLTLALVLALIVNRKVRGVGFFRTAYFSPAVLSLVVISILWTVLLNPNSGLINEILMALGLKSGKTSRSVTRRMRSCAARTDISPSRGARSIHTRTGGSISIGSGNNIFRADSAGIWAGHANFANAPFSVDMSGHMKAVGGEFSGTISASTINGGNISGATITGGIITGSLIQGATIQTSVTYPRIELSGNDLFAYRDASNYIMIDPDGPAISAMSGSTVRFYLGHMTYGGLLQSHGYIIISADNGISLQTSNVIEVPSWSQLRAANSYQDLQSAINQIWSSIADLWNALDGKADKGSLTGTAGPYNGGIPIGTNLMTSGGGVVTWNGIPAHSHVQS